MKVLFDHNIPGQIRRHFQGHLVFTAKAMGWTRLQNGELLRAAEGASFEVLLTGDQNLVYQQNNLARNIALVVVSRVDLRGLEEHIELLKDAVGRAVPGGYERIELPRRLGRRRSEL